MPIKKVAKKPRELTHKEIDYSVSYAPPGAKSSDDITPCDVIIGQERAIEAIKTGLTVKSVGYNIFVAGQAGTGRTTTIRMLLKQLDQGRPELNDYCYVNNFKNIDSPRMLIFEAGQGRRFKKDMEYLTTALRKVVPKIFLADDYKDRNSRITREFEKRQKNLIKEFEDKLTEAGFVMVQIQSGLTSHNEIHVLVDEEPVSLEKLEELSEESKFPLSKLDDLRRKWDSLRRDFDVTSTESKKLSGKLEDALEKLRYSMIAPLITDKINLLKKRYPGEKVIHYLSDAEEALLDDLDRFREAQARRGEEEPPSFRKREPFEEFTVNLVLDNADTETVPIIIEKSPTYKNLFGSLERVVDRFGYWRTDFTRIFSGSLLRAAGGYLVVNATDLFTEPIVWTQLKRTLRNRELEIASIDAFNMMAGSGIKPEAIPIDVKVVIIGAPHIYSILWQGDEEFKKIFKIKAEFDSEMKITKLNLKKYMEFIRKVIDEDHLSKFDISGMQAVVEYSKRLAGRRDRLSSRFTVISDIVRESAYCAGQRKSKTVGREDVYSAIIKRKSRVNLIEDKIQQMFDDDTLMVSTSGQVAGQINGLSVYNLGEYSFGRPTRITATTSLGKAGVINIEREADLSGPIHNKGVLILSGYLRQMFARDKPLVMSASISFEQSYSGVDGDSASSTEIYAILSAITGVPIKQSLAVTGSVNQKGQIQPIGGVNEKVEGFFDVCKSRKLTGHQGVIIPHQNVNDLMLRPDVADAIKAGKYHVYPIKTINEGIEILTGHVAGKPLASGGFTKGSFLDAVDTTLQKMALMLQNFGKNNDDNGNGAKKRKKTKSGKK